MFPLDVASTLPEEKTVDPDPDDMDSLLAISTTPLVLRSTAIPYYPLDVILARVRSSSLSPTYIGEEFISALTTSVGILVNATVDGISISKSTNSLPLGEYPAPDTSIVASADPVPRPDHVPDIIVVVVPLDDVHFIIGVLDPTVASDLTTLASIDIAFDDPFNVTIPPISLLLDVPLVREATHL